MSQPKVSDADTMTPPDAMVTELEIADMRGDHGYLFGGDDSPKEKVCVSCNEDWPCMYARLMNDRERTLRLLAGLLPAVDCPWEEGGTCTPENCMKEEARVALKEVHSDA